MPNLETGYEYDGHGRRVFANTVGSGSILSQFANSGQVLYQEDNKQSKRLDYVYLGNRLVAYRERPLSSGTVTVKYQHTDALGSPIAVTDAAKTLIESSEYEPFGQLVNKPLFDGPGYTGHVQDAATGLTYMQQRYYDPGIGRFLSVDPVGASTNNGALFNRYMYAANNPYRFYDPDGRCTGSNITNRDGTCRGTGGLTTQSTSRRERGEHKPITSVKSSDMTDAEFASVFGSSDDWYAYEWGDPLPQWSVDLAAGFGDGVFNAVTFGLGDLGGVRTAMNIDGAVNYDSGLYRGSTIAGNIQGGAALGGVGLRMTAQFARGRTGHYLFNGNRYFRVGPGRMPTNGGLPAGPKVPRASIGRGPNNPHIDLRIRPFDR